MNLREKCGIIGVFSTSGKSVARLAYYGLWSLQHRGQESSGIVSTTGRKLYAHRGRGLVAHVYHENNFKDLKGHIAIGHNRYSTFGGDDLDHSQPVFTPQGQIAIAHNGNLPTTVKIKRYLKKAGVATSGLNDSEMMHKLIEYWMVKGKTLEEAVKLSYPLFTGAFSLVILFKKKLVAVRDEYGIRPLVLGKTNGTTIIASETCALDTLGVDYVRDIKPGEMLVIDKDGFHSETLAKSKLKLDVFEFIYFARPDSVLLGKNVYDVRRRLGEELASEVDTNLDLVVPVPDSSIPSAIGYSQKSGIVLEQALVKNRYIHRTFIKPSDNQRKIGVKMKLNLIKTVVYKKRVGIVDDSVVRGNTSKRIVELFRSQGASYVHLLITSPPVLFPDFYGIDTPNQKELIAANLSLKELKKYIGADRMDYLTYNGMIKAIGIKESNLCTSCFTGEYPIDIGHKKSSIRKIQSKMS